MQYTGPPRGGATSGSCFPPDFGGSCSGTPPECQECKDAVNCDIEDNLDGALGGFSVPDATSSEQDLGAEGSNDIVYCNNPKHHYRDPPIPLSVHGPSITQ